MTCIPNVHASVYMVALPSYSSGYFSNSEQKVRNFIILRFSIIETDLLLKTSDLEQGTCVCVCVCVCVWNITKAFRGHYRQLSYLLNLSIHLDIDLIHCPKLNIAGTV